MFKFPLQAASHLLKISNQLSNPFTNLLPLPLSLPYPSFKYPRQRHHPSSLYHYRKRQLIRSKYMNAKEQQETEVLILSPTDGNMRPSLARRSRNSTKNLPAYFILCHSKQALKRAIVVSSKSLNSLTKAKITKRASKIHIASVIRLTSEDKN